MKRILFLINEYKPEFSANSSCVDNVINELSKNNKIDILTFCGDEKLLSIEAIDNVSIYRVFCKFRHDYNILFSDNRLHFSLPFFRFFIKLIAKIIVMFIWPDFSILSYRKFIAIGYKLIKANKYDAVVSSSGDFLVQIAAGNLKKLYDSFKWIAYFNDPMPINNFIYNKSKATFFNVKKQQKMLLDEADFILYDNELYKKYINNYSVYKDKMISVGIPSLLRPIVQPEPCTDNFFNIVFAGYLYRDIRNPEFMLRIVSGSTENIKLDIYGRGNCDDIIFKYTSIGNGKIAYRGMVGQDEVRRCIGKANALVNICNTISEQVPCKLFEYMATGLPIINIVKNCDDPTINYIKRYTNGINIFEGDGIEVGIRKLNNFCDMSKFQQVSYDEVECEFVSNTPQFTQRVIESLL